MSNYPTLAEQSIEHVNVHHVDVEDLNNGPYHPNVTGYDLCHQVLVKDQEWGGKLYLDTDTFYPAELKSLYYKDNEYFEELVYWTDWEGKRRYNYYDLLGTH